MCRFWPHNNELLDTAQKGLCVRRKSPSAAYVGSAPVGKKARRLSSLGKARLFEEARQGIVFILVGKLLQALRGPGIIGFA